jgi:DNA invertase Pin-like site-specific DNA recombinase
VSHGCGTVFQNPVSEVGVSHNHDRPLLELSVSTIGYARVSTVDQHLEQQIAALQEAGCERLFEEKISGAGKQRPQFDAMLDYVRAGDEVVVVRLDRLGRSLLQVVRTIADLTERGIIVRGLRDGVDTSTSAGRMVAGVMASLAEYERELLSERTREGLAVARRRGAVMGRPAALTAEQVEQVLVLREAGQGVSAVARSLDVSRSTIYRALEAREG